MYMLSRSIWMSYEFKCILHRQTVVLAGLKTGSRIQKGCLNIDGVYVLFFIFMIVFTVWFYIFIFRFYVLIGVYLLFAIYVLFL